MIDDNPYGLMVALSYIRRICPYALLEVHLLVSRSFYGDQGGIQGFIQRLVMWELSLLQVCLEEEDCVNIHVYLQDIIFVKREEKRRHKVDQD